MDTMRSSSWGAVWSANEHLHIQSSGGHHSAMCRSVVLVCLMDDVFLDGEVLSEDVLDSRNRIKDSSSVAVEAG